LATDYLGVLALSHYNNESLGDYLGGVLSLKDEADCERHLARCDSCRQQLSFLIRVMDDDLAPDEAAVIDCVEAFGPRRFPAFDEPMTVSEKLQSWFSPRWRLAGIAAGLMVCVSLALALWLSVGSSPPRLASIERTFEARIADQPYSEFIRTRNQSRVEEDRSGKSELTRLHASNADIGRFYLMSNNFAQAISYLETAKKEQSASPQVRNDLGVAYMESGKEGSLQRAMAEFEEALRVNPKYAPALFNVALVYERLGQFPEAEQRLRLYLQADQDSGWAKEVKSKLQASGR